MADGCATEARRHPCSGGTQVYGFTSGWKGTQLQSASDSVLGQSLTYGYDEFNRLSSLTVSSGTANNFSYVYDRWGGTLVKDATTGGGKASEVVLLYGVYYHWTGKTHAKNDPLDNTGRPAILSGIKAGWSYQGTSCP
ncbi:MAG TPA: hypothetical protein VHU44_12195 [Acidobacteriaceae bacterium]|jgi:hypothetical protein|nr:hypothetical protein [Acidobacteriaceae bacterium]